MDEPRRLGDRYELGAVLGRGGMAEVHMGRDARLGRTVAVKTLRADLARDPLFQARFRREAQSAASLNHPSVVSVYDTGEDIAGGISVPYIVMEYIDGSTLRELLHSGRTLLPERALEMTAGVLQALAYSHHNGIIHRDIKPANVMLTRGGTVKVMDFGIARAMADQGMTMTQTAAVIGTAQYLSPEQAKGEPVDARSDLYSTGCLLYELLTSRPPFIGDSPVAVAYQHVREDPQPPSTFDPSIPPAIDAIVLKALAKNPENRYQSADEMRADIERALHGEPVAAPTVMMQHHSAPPTRRMSAMPSAPPTARFPAVGDTRLVPATPARPAPRQRQGRSGGSLLLAIVFAAVLVGAFFIGRELFTVGPNEARVPDLLGRQVANASGVLEGRGLELGKQLTGEKCDKNAPRNTICKTVPAAGKIVDKGTTVDYVLSTGSNQAVGEMPDLEGKSLPEAYAQLQGMGLFNISWQGGTSDRNDPNTVVVSTNPAPGTDLSRDDKVVLMVERKGGDEPQTTTPTTPNGGTTTAPPPATSAPPSPTASPTTEPPPAEPGGTTPQQNNAAQPADGT